MATVNLVPCPFCGGEAFLKTFEAVVKMYFVLCPKCGAKGGEHYMGSRAIGLWNERTGECAKLRALAWEVAALHGGEDAGEAVAALGRALGYPGY